MKKHVLASTLAIGLLAVTGVSAQTLTAVNPPASTQFDGTYAFVSGTKLNETFTTTATAHVLQCPDWKGGRLLITNGHAQYPRINPVYDGTVGPQGDLMMRFNATAVTRGESPGVERTIVGIIDGTGMVRTRMTGYYCRYDLIWRKEPSAQQTSLPHASQ